MRDESPEQKKLRACRKRNLNKLGEMTVGEILTHIWSLKLNQAVALKRAMGSCTKTNCSWIIYDISFRFIDEVQKVIAYRYGRQTAKKSNHAATTLNRRSG